ncbi:protein kinase [bacterium]|nr:protein kinase [bacterium]
MRSRCCPSAPGCSPPVESEDFARRFAQEARVIAALEHIHILPVIAYGIEPDINGGLAYLAMRLLRGGTLHLLLKQEGALSLERSIDIFTQAGRGLAYAHERGVIHRDVKPGNIMFDDEGNVFITDFGLAKLVSGDETDLTRPDNIVGTPYYMSPEQLRGDRLDRRSDLYSMGVVLYEMLAGQHPFHETPIGTLLFKHMQEPLPAIHDIRDDLPPGIDDVIQKATKKDPSGRYASVLELATDLKVAVSGASSLVLQPTTTEKKPTTTAERNREAMLTNVRKFWVEGVLENSLHDAVMIDLGLKRESGAVDNPWDTLIRTPSGNETLNDERIIDMFDRLNGKLLILGDPGSGKTITLLTLARDLLLRAEADSAHPIPVVLNLSSWSENQPPLTEWLVEELNTKYQVPRKVGIQWVEADELLLLLDGLDEVASEWRDPCVKAINRYRSEHGFVDMVVCSRIADYEVLDAQLLMNGAVVIQPLDRAQIKAYFDVLGPQLAPIVALLDKDEALV